jgi:hypothetical protein
MIRLMGMVALVALVSGCVGPPKGRRPLSQRPGDVVPKGPDLRQCLSDLKQLNADYTLMPDRNFGRGCSNLSSVRLTSIGIPITNITAIRCALAREVALWTRDSVQPAARRLFGSPVIRVESMGSYSCRNVVGRPQAAGNRSEHATGNAIDIGGFVLASGRRISVAQGWQGNDEERKFLRVVRAAGCERFQTVLSPDYNAAHWDHLHFDMGRGPFCR